MQITEITVNAGRTFNHPYEQYSNLRPSVTLKATLVDGDDPMEAAKTLQAKAESLVEDHKRMMLMTIRRLYELSQTEQEIASVESQLNQAQMRLKNLRIEQGAMHLDNGKRLPDEFSEPPIAET